MAKSYLRQVESKNRQLASARTEVSNRLRDANTADAKVRTAEEKLRDAEASERAAQKRKDENKQNETRIASKSNRKAASGLLANAMSARKSELSSSAPPMKPPGNASLAGLATRTSALEQKLLAAERRAAPPEVAVLFLAASPEDQPPPTPRSRDPRDRKAGSVL